MRSIRIIHGTRKTSDAMPKFSLRWLIAGVVVIAFVGIAALFIRDAQTPATPVALPLTQTFDKSPTGFTLKYPDDWNYAIPSAGVFIIAPSQTLAGTEAGPTLTVQRANPLAVLGTLDKALADYLQSGPLHTPGRWQVTDTAHMIQFNGRDARMVELEGADA